MNIVAMIVGGILGAMGGEEFGFLVGVVLGWLVHRTLRQSRQIAALNRALSQGDLTAATTPDTAAALEGAPMAGTPAPRHGATVAQTADTSIEPPGSDGEAAPARPAQPSWTEPLRQWFFGGNTIVKAGVGILFLGLAFLAKYAGEHVDVPLEWRLAGIAGVAIALLLVGWRLRLARPGYAQVLQGGAVAALYLTLFVSFRYFGLLGVTPVFALMVLVAGLAAALAVLQNARSLAVIGALGGFATPLLVSSGSGNHVALFTYYLILDVGIAAVAWRRTWRSLNLIGFVGTYVVGTAWGVLQYEPHHYASSQAFLVAFFIVFLSILLMPSRRLPADDPLSPGRRTEAWVNGSLLFGLPTVSFALQYGLVRDMPYGAALSSLAFAVVYVALALQLRARSGMRLVFEASLALATVFLTLVVPFALDARSTAGAWALEGAGLVWLGLRQPRLIARLAGYGLLFLAGFSLLFALDRHGVPTSVFNAYFFSTLMLTAASLAAALFVHRHGASNDIPPAERGAAQPALIAWATLWLVAGGVEHIDLFVPTLLHASAWLAFVSAVALVYSGLSVKLAWPGIAWPVIALPWLMGLGALGALGAMINPLRAGGWWAWPLAFAAHGTALAVAARHWPAFARTAAHVLGVLVLAALGALLGRTLTGGWGDADSAWPWLGWIVVPAALLVVLPRDLLIEHRPVRDDPFAYRAIAGGVMAAGLLLWTVLANVASDGSARPLPHVPLVNPLDIGIAVALWACLAWARSDAARNGLGTHGQAPLALLAGAAFVWINAILIRAFHHHGGVPYRFEAWAESLDVQTGITLLWTTTALVLMWGSARRAARVPWITGAALLAAVVVKLLVVDLSGSGTVTRIVSFIGVGVLMLVIGYVAPLPSRESRHAVA
jgi:uncharacterized membrane protein